MQKVLIYLDAENFEDSVGLLAAADEIYKDCKYESFGLCINYFDDSVLDKFDCLIRVNDERINYYDIFNITNCFEDLYRKFLFDVILIPATQTGRMLAPRIAMRLQTGLVADVTGINNLEGKIEMIRPAFNGRILAAIVNQNCSPVMMSIRPNTFTYCNNSAKKAKIISYEPYHINPCGIKLLESKEKEKARDIRESKILVSGGGGVAENFHHLYLLADELGGMVSASRRVVDQGIASRSIQVGQSGKIVSPKLYIALGIYGSQQHIEGLKNVENIISVNINKDAPICSLSDIVVEGDAIEFINKLIKRIKKYNNTKIKK